ncbi:MAG TPA: nucleotide exchange factor GrpE [Fibrobacteria bacterium]|nr:nucleotide exchange factor GrpE [Fibrobacteria bacterium]
MEQQDIQTEQEARGQSGSEGASQPPEAGDREEGGIPAGGASGGEEALARELEVQKDRYTRLMAEFENFRRRTAKENFELVAAANAKLVGKLTDVLDNFELGFDPRHKTGSLEDFEKGIRLIYGKFKEILSEEGLEEINPSGQAFDPNLHDALMQQASDTVPENHVVQVLQKGYKVKSKILKHAKVIVSQGKA